MIDVGIIGATGYTGLELLKLLVKHPQVTIQLTTSQSQAGKTLQDIFPQAPAYPLVKAPVSTADFKSHPLDVVFLCLPHAAAAKTAVLALDAGLTVIDLSADFRLQDAHNYAHWYGETHPAPHLLAQAVYGLTEWNRTLLPKANLIANPGCYPTSVLLALQPILRHHAQYPLDSPIIVDAKSGVSGAGRAPQTNILFAEVSNNFTPYKIGRCHRHVPEIEQQIQQWNPDAPPLIFSPHLLPVPRGILSTIYLSLSQDWSLESIHQHYEEFYQDEPFIRLLPLGQLASLAHVTHTNYCTLSLTRADNILIITSTIDNLIKGAAGQAVQNMNVVFGFEETTALL